MQNRREFIKTAAGVTAGAFMMGRGLVDARAQVLGQGPPTGPFTRRIVQVGGKRVKVVDIHAHVTVAGLEPVLKGTPLERNAGVGNRLMGKDRIDVMDLRGIDVQALSFNGYWWYGAQDRELATKINRVMDEGVMEWCNAHSDRFIGLSSPTMQFPDLAAQQLDRAVKQLGMRGATVSSYVDGVSLSDPKFDVFWAKANELGTLVMMHPGGADDIIKERTWQGSKGDLGNIIGNPLETTYFLTKLMFEGTLDKFPRLKILGCHGGGYLPSYLGRTEVACMVRGNANCQNKKKPSEYMKDQILVDAMVFSPEGVRHLVAEMGPSQVVYGTDIPIYGWPDAVDSILGAQIPDAQKEMVLGGNLIKLLKL